MFAAVNDQRFAVVRLVHASAEYTLGCFVGSGYVRITPRCPEIIHAGSYSRKRLRTGDAATASELFPICAALREYPLQSLEFTVIGVDDVRAWWIDDLRAVTSAP